MRAKAVFIVVLAAAVLTTTVALLQLRTRPENVPPASPTVAPDAAGQTDVPEPAPVAGAAKLHPAAEARKTAGIPTEPGVTATNKVERLAQIREWFHALAAGDPAAAFQAAKSFTNEVERETALLTLVTEWTHGNLRSPRQRARDISTYGLEAGLGMELAGNPELALSWANALTDGAGRVAILTRTAVPLTALDPAGAFVLGSQLPEDQQRQFANAVLAGWAENDTAEALDWANQITDPTNREAALQAIRSVAPVGIGTELTMQDGYPVVHGLIPGNAAELSGQLHPGDRILALAQGDNAFVDAHGLALADIVQMVRGEPGTTLQLQILPADAPPDTLPRTVSIVRDQIKFKN